MRDTTVVVTGASRGIGAAVARLFGSEGAHVAVGARSMDDLEAVAADVEDGGGTATVRRTDVRDEDDVRRLMEAAAEAGGGIDLLVANAGIYDGKPGETPLLEESYGTFDDHLRTNGRGVYAAVREAAPHMAVDARVLVPSGPVARKSKAGYGSYAVSKATAEALVRGFAAELDQVVGVVDPGQVSTALTNEARGRDPDDVAEMFRWAAVEADDETVDGSVVDIRTWREATR